jgi:hypothetical protein
MPLAWEKPTPTTICEPRHVAQRLLALGLRGDLELAIRDARLLLEALDAVVGRLVEGLVELAAHVVHDGGLGTGHACAGHGNDEECESGGESGVVVHDALA